MVINVDVSKYLADYFPDLKVSTMEDRNLENKKFDKPWKRKREILKQIFEIMLKTT